MQILPVPTPLLRSGDDLAAILTDTFSFQDGDILAVSSKAVATVEGAAIDLSTLEITDEARLWAERCGKDPAFREAVLQETTRMNGQVVGWCPDVMLTELKPDGFPEGVLLTASAGLDQSNVAEGFAIGWPIDPIASVAALRRALRDRTGADLAVILTDSCTRPRRLGVTAVALVVSGIDPFESEIGKSDLFGRALRMTQEARADQLATAANAVMGNSAQSTPASVIRTHGLPFTGYEGWVPGIDPEEDLYRGMAGKAENR